MKIIKYLLIAVGGILIIDGMISALTANFSIGIIAEILLGLVFVLFGIFFRKMKKWQRSVIAAILAAVVLSCAAVWLYGTHDTADYSEDVLIVLGAGVHGEIPTAPLAARLDAAVEYLNRNSRAYVVVSGGQGPQESVTEASAMEKYLVSRGIDASRIIKEEKAASTAENYKFSKEIIDARFENAKIATITNDFHIYRARRYAKLAGFETSTVHARTPFGGRISAYLRELLAIAKLWVFGY